MSGCQRHTDPKRLTGRRTHSRGFTLNELVMIIVVIGILAVVVVPSFNSAGFLARGFYDEVKSAARHAQKLAVASGCPARLTITGSSYTLQQSSGCNATGWDIVVMHPARAGGYTGSAPAGVTLSGSSAIEFHPNGSSSAGSVTVGSHAFSVQVTGHVAGD